METLQPRYYLTLTSVFLSIVQAKYSGVVRNNKVCQRKLLPAVGTVYLSSFCLNRRQINTQLVIHILKLVPYNLGCDKFVKVSIK